MTNFPIDQFSTISAPFYYYDLNLLSATLDEIKRQIDGMPYVVHYAIKANNTPEVVRMIAERGFGVDIVSGGELKAALEMGFTADKMAYSSVGKTDEEIRLGIEAGICCFNVESIPELVIISEIAAKIGKKANVALRLNPDIDAHSHHYITTGVADNKFGINLDMAEEAFDLAMSMPEITLKGLHFHIGSQITVNEPFRLLCERVNNIVSAFEAKGFKPEILNVGGGLGIDYEQPDVNPIPDFAHFFDIFKKNIILRDNQTLHFELGRSMVAQCGTLVSKVLYVKNNGNKKFVILDAGMTDLIRPALYQAHHKLENLTSKAVECETYDIVGPVCETSDTFGENEILPKTQRGDIFAIRSAGAYGATMASNYNLRPIVPYVTSDKL